MEKLIFKCHHRKLMTRSEADARARMPGGEEQWFYLRSSFQHAVREWIVFSLRERVPNPNTSWLSSRHDDAVHIHALISVNSVIGDDVI